jgi:hypothetical protein
MARTTGALAAGLLVIALAACGSTSPTPAPSAAAPSAPAAASSAPPASAVATIGPSVAPSASASSAPSPSASAGTDVAAAFSKAVSDKLFRPHIDVKSVATVAGQTIAMQARSTSTTASPTR